MFSLLCTCLIISFVLFFCLNYRIVVIIKVGGDWAATKAKSISAATPYYTGGICIDLPPSDDDDYASDEEIDAKKRETTHQTTG